MGFVASLEKSSFVHIRREGFFCDLSFELRGNIAPFLEVTLGAGEGLICDRSCVLQHDFDLTIKPWPGLGASRWLVVNTGKGAETSVMLTTVEPGCAGSFNLGDHGGKLICLAESLMANGPGVTASYYARFAGMGISLVLLEGHGWAFLRSRGDVFEYCLTAGEKLCVRARNVAVMTATVDFEPVMVTGQTGQADETSEFVTLTGPGSIWLQSISQSGDLRLPGHRAPDNLNLQEMRIGDLAFLNGTSA